MMRDNQSYIRFHVRVDDALNQACESAGLKRATMASWILNTYLRRLHERIESGDLSLLPEMDEAGNAKPFSLERLGLSAAASVYALKRGRTVAHAPRSIGKPILLTLPTEATSELRFLADLCGMSLNHFRSVVVASFLIEQKVLV
jgi:hypothetical protein